MASGAWWATVHEVTVKHDLRTEQQEGVLEDEGRREERKYLKK